VATAEKVAKQVQRQIMAAATYDRTVNCFLRTPKLYAYFLSCQ